VQAAWIIAMAQQLQPLVNLMRRTLEKSFGDLRTATGIVVEQDQPLPGWTGDSNPHPVLAVRSLLAVQLLRDAQRDALPSGKR
jgi:hypothetical protein